MNDNFYLKYDTKHGTVIFYCFFLKSINKIFFVNTKTNNQNII